MHRDGKLIFRAQDVAALGVVIGRRFDATSGKFYLPTKPQGGAVLCSLLVIRKLSPFLEGVFVFITEADAWLRFDFFS